jgi:hypothetical protein
VGAFEGGAIDLTRKMIKATGPVMTGAEGNDFEAECRKPMGQSGSDEPRGAGQDDASSGGHLE